MPKFYPHRTKASELNHNDLANIGASDHHTKYTDEEAEAAALANADIADAIDKKHSNALDHDGDVQDTAIAALEDLLERHAAKGYRGVSDQIIPTGTWTKVELNRESYDAQGEFDPVTNFRFTAKKAGDYQVNGSVSYRTPVADKIYIAAIKKNGVFLCAANAHASHTGEVTPVVSDLIPLAVNDYLELWTYHTAGGDESLVNQPFRTFMSVRRIP